MTLRQRHEIPRMENRPGVARPVHRGENDGCTSDFSNHQSGWSGDDGYKPTHHTRDCSSTIPLRPRDRCVTVEVSSRSRRMEHEVCGQDRRHGEHPMPCSPYSPATLPVSPSGMGLDDWRVADEVNRPQKQGLARQSLGEPSPGHTCPAVPKPSQNHDVTEGREEGSGEIHRRSRDLPHRGRGSFGMALGGKDNPRGVLLSGLASPAGLASFPGGVAA